MPITEDEEVESFPVSYMKKMGKLIEQTGKRYK